MKLLALFTSFTGCVWSTLISFVTIRCPSFVAMTYLRKTSFLDELKVKENVHKQSFRWLYLLKHPVT